MALIPDIYDHVVVPLFNDYDIFQQRYLNRNAYNRWIRRQNAYLRTTQAFHDTLTHDDVDLLAAIVNQESIGHVTSLMGPETPFADLVNWYLPGKVLDYLTVSQNRDDDDNVPRIQIQYLVTEYPETMGYKLALAAGKLYRSDEVGRIYVDYIYQLIADNDLTLQLLLGLVPVGFTGSNQGDLLSDLLDIFHSWQLPISDDDKEELVWAMMAVNQQRRETLGEDATGYTTEEFGLVNEY